MTDATPPRIAVCGADHVALALSLARAGCPVVLFESDLHDRARLSDMLRRGGMTLPDGLVLTRELDTAVDLILGSGVKTLDAVAEAVPTVSLDWASPDHAAMHLSEVPGRRSLIECLGSDPAGHIAAIARALDARMFGLPIGQVPPSQRLLAVLSAEIEALALAGATPEEIDGALVAAGFALGPFEAQDLAGIDLCLASRRAVFARYPGPPELPLFARAVSEGRLGRKVGVGWYRYPGGGGKVEDPLIEDMAVEEARFAGLPRCQVDAGTIPERVCAALREEAGKIVNEGALSSAAVDEIAQLSIGTPPRLMQ